MPQIKEISTASPVRRKIAVGECLVAINGEPIKDVLDYQYHSYDAALMLTTKTKDGRWKLTRIEKDAGADLGLTFESYLMDSPRRCANRCIFCFIDQLPSGMRESLYFKDDDARLSFLTGNYITLTNLTDCEIGRIIQLQISPLGISVHATQPEVRVRMLRNPNAGQCLNIMTRFAKAGITMNAQIVLCPGINDEAVLSQSMTELAALYPAVQSVSIVPLGLTKHRAGLYPLTPFTQKTAARVIAQVEIFAETCLAQYGSRVFFCGDELYLKAGLPMPNDAHYESYPQLENGVGLCTLLETEFHAALGGFEPPPTLPEPFSIATGTAAALFLQNLLQTSQGKYGKIDCKVYAIRNNYFGESVTVAGLITGVDLVEQLQGKDLGTCLLIPQSMLRQGEDVFLDDMTVRQAADKLGIPIVPVAPNGNALLQAMMNNSQRRTPLCQNH